MGGSAHYSFRLPDEAILIRWLLHQSSRSTRPCLIAWAAVEATRHVRHDVTTTKLMVGAAAAFGHLRLAHAFGVMNSRDGYASKVSRYLVARFSRSTRCSMLCDGEMNVARHLTHARFVGAQNSNESSSMA